MGRPRKPPVGKGRHGRKEARDSHTDHTGDYLVGIPLLGTYLEEGLNQFGLSCE